MWASRCSGPASGRRGMWEEWACGRDHRAHTTGLLPALEWMHRCRAPAALETPARGRSSGTAAAWSEEGGRVVQEGTLHKLISDADSRLGASWCLGKPPSRSRKCLHRMGRSRMPSAARVCASVMNRPMRMQCSRTRCRGAGSRAGEVCHPAERQSVGAEADAKGSLLLAPATHSPHRERGEWRHIAREGQAGGAAHRESESGWKGGDVSFAVVGDRRDVVFPLSCPVDRRRVLLWGRSTTLDRSP